MEVLPAVVHFEERVSFRHVDEEWVLCAAPTALFRPLYFISEMVDGIAVLEFSVGRVGNMLKCGDSLRQLTVREYCESRHTFSAVLPGEEMSVRLRTSKRLDNFQFSIGGRCALPPVDVTRRR